MIKPGWKTTPSSLFSFHFLPAFLSAADTCRYNRWYVICAHTGWIKFLMAPRAAVLAIKKCCNSEKRVDIQNHFCSSLKERLNAHNTFFFCNFLIQMLQIRKLSVWTRDQREVASAKWRDKRAIGIQDVMLWRGRSLKTWHELCHVIVSWHYVHSLRLNNLVCGS